MKLNPDTATSIEKGKAQAALKVTKEFVFDGFVLGIGTGSTVKYFIQAISELIEKQELDVILVPSSIETELELIRNGLSPSSLKEFPELSLYVDSADIVSVDNVLIKGGGAALTVEKIMARATQEFIVIIDDSKYPKKLIDFPVPIEIIPQAVNTIIKPIFNLGGDVEIRYGTGKIGPVVSDNSNIIADVHFNESYNAKKMEIKLNNIPGIVENGIFPDDIHRLVIGKENSVDVINLK